MSLSEYLSGIINDVTVTKYFSAIGFTIVCYDTCLTLPDEIRLVWPERMSLVKALFYFNRIISFFFIALNTYHLTGISVSFSELFCQVLILTTGYGAIFSFAITNWLLLARAIALWGGSRKIVWGMTTFYLITYAATITLATNASIKFIDHISFFPLVRICVVDFRPSTFGAIWVPSIVFDVVLFILLFWKLFQHARAASGTTIKLIHTLHRDGIMYFIVIFCLRVFNLIAWAALPISLIFIGIFLLWSCTTVLVTRMHLNLKAIGAQYSSDDESSAIKGIDIDFKVPTDILGDADYARDPVSPMNMKQNQKKKKRRRDLESNIETNLFPGGTRIDVHAHEYDVYKHEQMAVTRPGTAL